MNKDVDVVIIGAGITGLTASRDLRERGFTVCCIEGQDRIGGRLYTRPFAGHPDLLIEAGGAHINLQGEVNLRGEVERYAIPIYTKQSQANVVRFVVNGELRHGLPVPPDQLWAIERVIRQMSADAARINSALPLSAQNIADLDVSVKEYFRRLDLPKETTDLVTGVVSGWMPASCDLTSIIHPLQAVAGCGGSPLETFVGVYGTGFLNGVSELIAAIASDADVDIVTGDRVVAIAEVDEHVVVTTASGQTFIGAAALVTVPPFALRNIAFDPPLSGDKREILRREHGVRGTKKHFIVEGAPAGFLGLGGLSSQLNHLLEANSLGDGRSHLIGFTYREDLASNDLELAQAAVGQFLPEATVLAVDGEDWYGNPLFGGAQAYCPPGMSRTFSQTMSRSHGRISFAGTEYCVTGPFWGWMEGALESSYRASRQVAATLHAARRLVAGEARQ